MATNPIPHTSELFDLAVPNQSYFRRVANGLKRSASRKFLRAVGSFQYEMSGIFQNVAQRRHRTGQDIDHIRCLTKARHRQDVDIGQQIAVTRDEVIFIERQYIA